MSQKLYNKTTSIGRKVKTITSNEKDKFLYNALRVLGKDGISKNNNSWNAQFDLKKFYAISMDLGLAFGQEKDIQNVMNIICAVCKHEIKLNKALEHIIKTHGPKMLEALLKVALYIAIDGNKRKYRT